ncbi:hypothetical protein PFISCL1PPCAC_2969, partial [Pristionchus fissidentatus]
FLLSHRGPSGYSFSAATYQTLILGMSSTKEDNLGEIRRTIMPKSLPDPKFKLPSRSALWRVPESILRGWAMMFSGSDKSIVQRSQYYDYVVNGKKPVQLATYFTLGSLSSALMLAIWMKSLSLLSQFELTRRFLQKYPEQFSFNMFKIAGPTKQQMDEASFEYFFFGQGWGRGEAVDEQKPTKSTTVVCRGPDPGYIASSACVATAALAVLDDREKMPRRGGVYTTASAFRETRILEYLNTFGITYEI